MKVYVDELPKDCIDCPCESEYYCNINFYIKENNYGFMDFKPRKRCSN